MLNQSVTTPTNSSTVGNIIRITCGNGCRRFPILNPAATAHGINLRVCGSCWDHFLTIFTRGTYLLGPLDRAFVMSRKSKSGTLRPGE